MKVLHKNGERSIKVKFNWRRRAKVNFEIISVQNDQSDYMNYTFNYDFLFHFRY